MPLNQGVSRRDPNPVAKVESKVAVIIAIVLDMSRLLSGVGVQTTPSSAISSGNWVHWPLIWANM